MIRASVQTNQLDYLATLTRPALALWGDGARLLQGLYDSFVGLHHGLNDIKIDGDAAYPAQQGVTVTIKPNAYFRFRFDRIEVQMANFSLAQLGMLPDILSRGNRWLRSSVQGAAIQSHAMSYSSHSKLDGATSADVLRGLTATSFPVLGENAGAGIIYRSRLPDRSWNIQLTLDHSLVVPDGLFVHFEILMSVDQVDYGDSLSFARQLLDGATASIGVKIEGNE